MIKFDALIQAIYKSVQDAVIDVETKNFPHIDHFFCKIDPSNIEAENCSDPNLPNAQYRPKMVTMEFPKRTVNGIENVQVNVPLIVLSPVTTQRVARTTLTTDLEIATDESGNLQVSFPTQGTQQQPDVQQSNARIEITIETGEPPEGLRKVIDGYERVLRAQLPG